MIDALLIGGLALLYLLPLAFCMKVGADCLAWSKRCASDLTLSPEDGPWGDVWGAVDAGWGFFPVANIVASVVFWNRRRR